MRFYRTSFCLILNKIGIQKQLFKTQSLRGFKLVLLLSMLFSIESFGQFTDCKNNNNDVPSYTAPGRVVTGLPVYLEVDLSNWDNTVDSDFCIGNSGPNDTDGGCGTFIFKNFPKTNLVENCVPKVCFSPRQGCGNALGNVCFWQENPIAPGTWESLGSFDKDNVDQLCLDAPADSDELAITICRPGQGPVSLQDMTFTSCEPEVTSAQPQTNAQLFCGVPEIVCPTDFVACPSSATTPDITGNPTLTGSGSTCLITSFYSDVVLPVDGCPNGANIVRTWTAHYEGTPTEIVTCIQNLQLIDTEAPVINGVPADEAVSCDAVPDALLLTATDNCDANATVSYLEWRDNGACENSYVLTRKYTATDACGNEASEMQFITVTDDTPPVIADVPANEAVSCDAIPNAPILTATDNCDTDVTVAYLEWRDNGVCENNYMITRKWTATDACGNEAIGMQILTVYDNTPPVLTAAPAHASVSCDAVPNAVILTATDNCDLNVTVDYLEWRDNGTCDGNYVITRKWTATDACGNEATEMQFITVSGSTPPTFVEVPADVTIECAGALPTTLPTATGACDAGVSFDFSDVVTEGTCGDRTYIRTWTATDDCGNTSSAIQTIVVEGVMPLTIRGVPADMTISCTDGIPAPTLPSATTSCILDAVITFEEVSTAGQGICANAYTITRTWTATDYCDNSVSATQIITVIDEDAPIFSTIPADVAASCDAIPNAPVLTATDGCDGNVVVAYLEWRDNGACDNAYTITRKWTAADACGNEAIVMQIISVTDTDAPTFTNVPANAVINCGETLPTIITPTATDVCGTVSISLAETQTGESCGEYTHVRTWTATDACGNTSTAVQEIAVYGSPSITLNNIPADASLTCDQGVTAAPNNITATDACGGTYTVTLETIQTDNTCGTYTITRTWSADDGCGGVVSGIQTINIIDDVAPVFAGAPSDLTVTCESAIPSAPVLTATDNCGGTIAVDYLEWRDNGTCANTYTLTRKWSAADACGNEVIAMQFISISDDVAPTVTAVPADITVSCATDLSGAPVLTATDACGESVTVAYLEWRDNGACDSEYTITRKWTATDACGNEGIGMQIITVTDDTAPTFTNVPANAVINCGEAIPTVVTPTVSDVCGTATVSLAETQAGETCGGYILVRTWTATDDCGNSTTAVQEIEIKGAPVVSLSAVPGDTWFTCGQTIPAAGTVTAADACGNTYTVTYAETQSDDDCGSYVITRTWTASDGCGSAAIENQVITITDEEAPIIAGTVADLNIECGAAIPGAPVLTATDNCGGNIAVDYLEWRDNGSCVYDYTITRKWTATDACGNEAIKMQIITVEDTTPPVITNAPANMVVNCGDAMPDPIYPTAQDACGTDVYITYEEVQNSSTSCGSSVVTRTWTIADDCGNTTTHVQEITQNGSPAVNFNSVPNDLSLACGQAIPSSFSAVSATDACGGTYLVDMTESTEDGTCGNSIMTRTWVAANGCGGTVSASQVITIAKPMEISFSEAPAAVTLACAEVVATAPALTASDACGTTYEVSLTESTADQGCGLSLLTRTWTAFDACGNEYTTTQQINQKRSVGIFLYNIPRDATVACGEAIPAPYNVTADNLCGQAFVVNFEETTTGSDCGQQTITRTWMAEDDCGEQVIASQKITVNGTSSIVFNNVPTDATITCGQQIAPAATINATDACGNSYNVNVEESRVDGDCGNYTLLRTWSIANGCGGVETAFQTITVQDAGSPVLSGVPANATVACGEALPASANVIASDACGYNYSVALNETSVNHADGSYTITRTWKATDACGNAAEAAQTITVEGSAASISLQGVPTNTIISCGDKVPELAHVTASDTNDNFYGVTHEETRTELANGAYDLARIWSAVDACGNATTGTQIITVQAAANMSLTGVPTDVTLKCGQAVPAATNVTATDTYNNNYTVNYAETRTDGSCNSYTIVRTWTAAGGCNNDVIGTQTITGQASNGPVLSGVPANATVACGEALPASANVIARDACGYNYTVALNETSVNHANGSSTITRTWRAIDACSNEVEGTQTITVEGSAASIGFQGVPTSVTISCGDKVPDAAHVTASDTNDHFYGVTYGETTTQLANGAYSLTRVWSAVDACGNASSATQIITVQAAASMSLYGVPTDVTLTCGQTVPTAANVTATDTNNNNYAVNYTETRTDGSCDSYNIVRTWSAAGGCSNDAIATQTITVQASTGPVLNGVPANITLGCGDAIPANAAVSARDACGYNYTVAFTEATTNSDCDNSVITRTWSAIDACGNAVTATQDITINGDEATTFKGIPSNANVSCGLNLPAAPTVTATNGCGASFTVSFEETTSITSCGSSTITRTWTAPDGCNGTISTSQIIKLSDSPTITLNGVPADAIVACGQAIPAVSTVTGTDDCGLNYSVNFTEAQSGADCGSYTLLRTWTASSACGVTEIGSQTITVEGGSAITLTGVPTNATVACGQTVPSAASVTATDACGSSYIVNYNETQSGSTCGSYVLTRTWNAASTCGGTATASQTITVEGGSAITLAGVPTNATVACGQTVPSAASVTATDACGSSYIVNYNETQSGSTCGSYILTRTWNAASTCGGTATASQTITVKGGSTITLAGVPTNATVACGQTIPAVPTVTGTDDCGLNYTVNFTETQIGEDCGTYTLLRTWSASSACGVTEIGSQTITVEGGSVITLVGVPTNTTIACGQTVPGAANVTATDACGNSYIVNYNETQSGSTCGSYVLTRTWSATSTCDGTATAFQTITVEGGSAITLAGVPTNATIACGQAVPALATVTASDDCGTSYTVYLNETQSGTTCSSYVLTRTWTASDNCNNTIVAVQEITVQGAAAITFYEVPAAITIACGQAVPAKAPVYARDACGSSYIVSFNETQTSATTCGSSTALTRVWTARDACGNATSATQILTLQGTPNISLAGVPANVTVSCDAVPSAANVIASDACGTNYGVALQEIIINVNCPQSYQIKRTWTSDDVCGSNASAIQLITVIDETAPELTCPDDMTFTVNLGDPITWTEPVATDNCGIVELIASHTNGGIFDAGVTVVTYTATDECNNTTNCDFEIDVDIDAPQQSACQEDIQITCSGTEQGIVTWSPPAIDLSCTSCSANPAIAGFLYMGERGGHRYYCSDTETTWHQANAIANQMGGYLAAIDDPAENAYLANFLTTQHAFIGLNDENSEGNFSWSNGQTLNFTNWYADQPNNYANAQHFVQLLHNGQWNDESANKLGEFIVEIPCVEVSYAADGALNGGTFPAGTTTVTYKMKDKCGNIQNCDFEVTVTTDITMATPEDIVVECNGANGSIVSWVPPTATSCCNSCPAEGTDLPGFIYMGSYNGHQYYCSKEAATWQTANSVSNQYGGYLASINSADENDFLAAFLTTQSVFIGANDKAQEGNFKWASGEPMTYSNWHAGQPNNMNGDQDYCQMISDGRWDDIFNNAQLEFVLELPCTDVYQTEGPINGTVFPIGTTTVTYEAGDDCGNVTTQSFNVTVNQCAQSQGAYANQCTAQGASTDYLWIDHIRVGALDNCSGNNDGYGDFTSYATSMAAGSSQSLYCYPGFGQGTYYVNWACWIDYNGDGDFDDANEEVFTYRHYNALRVNFKVPYACVSGPVRMRVAMKYGDYATPCEIFEDGEVEDYTIILSSYGLRTTTAGSRSSETFDVEVLEDADLAAPTGAALPTAVAASETASPALTTEMEVSVYPNPVQHELSIDIAGYEAIDGQLQIFNQLGQQVHQVNLDNQTTQQVKIDVRDYMEGIYNIQLANGTKEPVTKQFIKIR